MEKCKKCNSEYTGNYCQHCGLPAKLERIDLKYIINEIRSVVNLEKGFFFTVKELILRPEKRIRQFIEEDRNQIVKPVLFVIICSVTYSIISNTKSPEKEDFDGTAVSYMFDLVSNNQGIANIILAIFTAFWVRLFFRKYKYNFFEIIILLCFLVGIQLLINSILEATKLAFEFKITFPPLIAYVYSGWVIGRFFNKRKIMSYVLGYLSLILGAILFLFSVIGLGELIDLIRNNYS